MMKRNYFIVAILSALLTLSGCANDLKSNLEDLRNQIKEIETTVKNLNTQISAVQVIVDAVRSNNLISSVTPVGGDKNKPDAYLFTFANGTSITIWKGQDGNTPILGLGVYDDKYYWTVKGEDGTVQWLKNSLGLRVRAYGITPKMKVEDGYWWLSYNDGSTWTKLQPATGNDGISFFKRVDISHSDYIIIETSEGYLFNIPTVEASNMVETFCKKINNNVKAAEAILAGIDTTMFVESVSEIVSEGKVEGYSIIMKGGKEFKIYNGKSIDVPFDMIAKKDSQDNRYYWAYKTENDKDYVWLTDSAGNKISAVQDSGNPQLSAKDSLGIYYFTVSYNGVGYNWLKNAKGEKIRASDYDGNNIFKSVEIKDNGVVLTLGNDQVVTLPLYREPLTYISVTAPESVSAGGVGKCDIEIVNLISGTKDDAIGLNGVVVTSVGEDGLYFTVPEGATGIATILVFATWGQNTIMKVIEIPIVAAS